MEAYVSEWLHLFLRWMHIIAGIMWIGTSIFFNWLDSHITASAEPKEGVEGELWMVHSGGFYQVEKKLVAPDQLPPTLHWFKWEAAFTWLSGFFLLSLIYYMRDGIYLVDPSVADLSPGLATVLGIGLLVVAWLVYDGLWLSPLARSPGFAAALSYLLVVGVAFGLSHVFSGRAVYYHVGAMLGTLMVANVWMRIIPAQRALVAATKEGRQPDAELARKAKQRSRHNNYLTYPVLFMMVSNHFPTITYGFVWNEYRLNWVILSVLILIGAGIRHYENTGERSPKLLLGVVGAAAVLVAVHTLLGPRTGEMPAPGTGSGASAPSSSSDQARGGGTGPAEGVPSADAGSIRGVVHLDGPAPKPTVLAIPADCAAHAGQKGPVFSEAVLVREGKLQNAFLWIKKGLKPWKGPRPTKEVVIDQRGCIYAPHVLGVQVGQPVKFLNSDLVVHNVHAICVRNSSFNFSMAAKGTPSTQVFHLPEVMVQVKCDVHPWMKTFIGVVPHPYFAVSGPDGEFTLQNVPPGEYDLEAWHEEYGRKTHTVTVNPGQAAQADFTFTAK